MNKNFKCPKCGAVNEHCFNDCFDEEEYDSKIIKKYYGYCGICEIDLVWNETYNFEGYSDIETRES